MESPQLLGRTPEHTYPIIPDRFTLLENELKAVQQRQTFQQTLWIVLFVLLIAGFLGFGVWQYLASRDAKNQRENDVAAMQKKMDEMDAKWLSRLDEKTNQLTTRYDGLSDRLATFEETLSWIKGRQDTLKEWYPAPVDPASK